MNVVVAQRERSVQLAQKFARMIFAFNVRMIVIVEKKHVNYKK